MPKLTRIVSRFEVMDKGGKPRKTVNTLARFGKATILTIITKSSVTTKAFRHTATLNLMDSSTRASQSNIESSVSWLSDPGPKN